MSIETLQMILTIIGIIGSVGFLAGGVGFLYSKFQKGKNEEKEEVISSSDQIVNFWKEQAIDYKEMMKVKDEKNAILINDLTRQVGELKGQLDSEKSQNERLEKIFQNRNPEMVKFMEFMVKAAEDQAKFHIAIIEVLKELKEQTK